VNIRKFVLGLQSLDELTAVGSLPEQAARFLEACVAAGLNILVSGGTQAGNAALLAVLALSRAPRGRGQRPARGQCHRLASDSTPLTIMGRDDQSDLTAERPARPTATHEHPRR